MELLGVIDVPLWFILMAGCILLLYMYGVYPFSFWKNLGIDGPKPVPFFGNALTIFSPMAGYGKSFKKWQEEYGKVFGCYLFRKPVIVVSDVGMLKEIFVKQFHNVSDRFVIGDNKLSNRIVSKGLFFAQGLDWQRLRRIMSPTFSSGKIKQLVGHMNRTGHHLSDKAYKCAMNGNCLAAKDVFGAYALDAIAAMAFGLDINSQNDFDMPFIKNAKSLLTFKTMARLKMITSGIFPPILKLYQLFDIGIFDSYNCDYFEKSIYSIINDRKDISDKDIPADFLQFLLNAEADEDDNVKDKKLNMKEIASQCIIFIIAGYETTSSALQFISYELARNQSIQEKLWDEIQRVVGDDEEITYDHILNLKYLSAVIYESLRMYPPVHLVTRTVTNDCVINGFELPKNTAVFMSVFNIGRDPELFEDPDVFNPDRFLNDEMQTNNDISFLPFGFGPRQCIGMRLSFLEVKVAVFHMLRRVIVHDATPKTLEFDDVAGLLVPKVPIELSFKIR